MCLTVRTLSSRIRRNGTPGVRMWWRNSIVTQTLENRTATVTSQNQGAFPSKYRALLATNGHKPIKGESDGEPDRAVSGCIKQDGVDITHGDGVPQEIKLFLINNGNVSQDQVEDNDQEIRRCHGPQARVPGGMVHCGNRANATATDEWAPHNNQQTEVLPPSWGHFYGTGHSTSDLRVTILQGRLQDRQQRKVAKQGLIAKFCTQREGLNRALQFMSYYR
ncbi:uncharacterized protein LOC132834280 isoform X2 [Hemiscyllium ocellatum]|uniref:uncharacterized protein LOC132834280 isoform X2 n=1 Tax=Hemiscyllium ocellatum TaxID=170820 RepID=UPI00296724EA|nr:uncharacterized protein LOC132834280 isoform X2 [Hemiscyllium ocellatum]